MILKELESETCWILNDLVLSQILKLPSEGGHGSGLCVDAMTAFPAVLSVTVLPQTSYI